MQALLLCLLCRETVSPKIRHCLRINTNAIKMDFGFNHSFLLRLAIPEPKGMGGWISEQAW